MSRNPEVAWKQAVRVEPQGRTKMPRAMTEGPMRDFIYYAVLIGTAVGLTQLIYMANGLAG